MLLDNAKLEDEEGRVRALQRYDILDTEEEGPFETIVTLVQQTLGVPMCGVSLIDRRRHWFKARRGVGLQEFERRLSFCSRTISQPGALVIPDTHADPDFADHPLVVGDPKVRAYVGIPLTTPDGYNIGSLCMLDAAPRTFGDQEISILGNFAKIVMNQLELRQMATTDGLTGVMTRRACLETARKDIRTARADAAPYSVAIFDIDRFKSVNDTHGHAAGDQVIRRLSSHVSDALGEQEMFGRLGGEEFVLAMSNTDLDTAVARCDAIRSGFEALRTPVDGAPDLACTVSIGVAGLGDADSSIEDLLSRADEALYRAKNAGRNRVETDRIA